MALRSILSKAAAGTAARAASLVPVEKRLVSSEKKLSVAQSLTSELVSKFNQEESDIRASERALSLSSRSESDAKNRIASAATNRETSNAKADLRQAIGLSKRNRSSISKQKKKHTKTAIKVNRAVAMRNNLVTQTDRLKKQVAASRAAAPSRFKIVRGKTSGAVRGSFAQARAARAKFDSPKPKPAKRRRRNKFN